MKQLIALAMTFIAVAEGSGQNPVGPFGFRAGMTTTEAIAAAGGESVVKEKAKTEDVITALSLTKAPQAHPKFDTYMLFFFKGRLVLIKAVTVIIRTSRHGYEFKREFDELKNTLTNHYGQSRTFDFLSPGSIWNEPEDFMMGLLKNERSLASFWLGLNTQSMIRSIKLEAKALNSEAGLFLLEYQLEGSDEAIDALKAKRNSVF